MQEQETPNKKNNRREIGQSLVEFALSGMLLVMLFSGMVDFGRLYFTYVALEDSAGEAALFLSLYPECVTAGQCADPNNAQWRARNAVGGNLDWSSAQILVPFYPVNPGVGDTVTIQIRYQYTVITPMIQAALNLASGTNQFTLEVTAQQVIVSEN